MEKCDDKMMYSGRRKGKNSSIKNKMIRKFMAHAMHGSVFDEIESSGATTAPASNGE